MRLAALALVLVGACRVDPPAPRPESRAPIAPQPNPSLRSVDDGIGAYKAERYAEAVWCFAEIAAGRIPGDRPRAEFWLGKSAIRIDDDERAIGVFVAIAGDPEHPSHTLALPWLAYLRLRHPDDARLDRAIARYPLEVLENEVLSAVLDQLQVAFAAQRLRSADAAGAYALAVAVAAGTDAHREAQLIAGLAADRLGREGEAIAHLRTAATPTKRASTRRRRAPPTRPRDLRRDDPGARAAGAPPARRARADGVTHVGRRLLFGDAPGDRSRGALSRALSRRRRRSRVAPPRARRLR